MGKHKQGGADFKRRKAKVGKKVEKATSTSTSFKAKRISLAQQSIVAGPLSQADVRTQLAAASSLLRHTNESNRSKGVEEIKRVFEGREEIVPTHIGESLKVTSSFQS